MRRYFIRLVLLVAGALFLPGPVDAQVHFGLPSAVQSAVKKLKSKKNSATVSSIVLGPLTSVLSADTNSKFISVSPDSVTYHYDISATQLAGLNPGAILLSSQGDGLLKKIVSINTTSTEYLIQTTTATLEEAFQKLDVSFTQTFTPSQVSPQYLKGFRPQSVSLGQFEISTSVALSPNITADVTLTFTPSIDGKIKIDWFQLKEFAFTSTFDGQLSYSLTAGAAETLTKEITVTEFPLGAIMAGPVPIVANYAIKVGIEANLQAAVTTGVTQDVSFESGVSYLNGIWTPHNTLSNTFTFTPLTGSAEGSVKGYIAPEINTKIFNVVGPYVNMEGYLKGIVTTPLLHLPWAIKGGVTINGGTEVDVLGLALAKYTVELYNAEIQLSSGAFFNQSPAISAVTPNPISVSTGGATNITCAATDSDSDTLTYTWSAASGAVTGTGSQITWTAPIAPSTYTITCGVADGWGGFVQKSTNVVVSATNHPPVIISVTANPASVSTGAATTVTCAASDPDNDTLTYDWGAASGTISGIGSEVTWTAPTSSSTYAISCTVTDAKGAYVQKSTNVVVTGTSAQVSGVRLWTKQLGTVADDYGNASMTDSSGNVYISGATGGGLDGNINAGDMDMFLVKYNSSGTKQWTKQFGTPMYDFGYDVTIDFSGNVYVSGDTSGGFDGNTNTGGYDAVLVKYNSSGTTQWTKQFGTALNDFGTSVVTDSLGNVYVAGNTWGGLDGNINAGGGDMFLVKYNSSGTKQWTKQLGTTLNDSVTGVVTDSSDNVYVVGGTDGGLDGNTNAGGADMVLIKYNSSGTKQWTKQLGTIANDSANAVVIDSFGNVYVAGETKGGLDGNTNMGGYDTVIVKYNSSGTKQWANQLGTALDDFGTSVVVDSIGNVYIAGGTYGGLDGNINTGGVDMFFVKYNSSGIKQWTKQLGTTMFDFGRGIGTDSSGNVYVSGETKGSLDGNINAGNTDMFLCKYAQ